MPVTPTPALPAIPPFPALADRATGTYNSKAYTWATEWDTTVAPALEDIAEAAEDNATYAQDRATAAAASASTATTQASTATTQATAASVSAAAAAASAASAVNAPGTSGTSTTSITVGAGTKTLTTQTGKAWVVGQPVTLARTSDPVATRMWGTISAYNSGSGSISIVVADADFAGTGTHTDWTIGLAGQEGPAGEDADQTTPSLALSGTPTLVAGNNGYTGDVAAGAAIALDTLASLGDGYSVMLVPASTTNPGTVTADFGSGSETRRLAGPTLISVKNVSGTYTVRWLPLGNQVPVFGAVGTAQVITAASSNNDIAICQLSATLAMVIYRNASGFPQAAIVDQTGAKVSGHTPIQLEAEASQATMQVIRVSATTAIAVWGNGTNAKAVHLTVSGNVITAGSVLAASSDNCNAVAICLLTATKFIIAYYKISGDVLCARTLTLSGTTLTANTEYTLAGTPGSSLVVRLAAMSSTQALATFCGSSLGSVARGLVITEASNVLTFPSHASYCTTGSANTTGAGDIVSLTATRAVAVVGSEAGNTGYGNALVVDFSGTGASATMNGGRPTMVAPGESIIGHRLALLSSATVLHLGPVGASLFASVFLEALAISGDGVFQGASVLIARTTGRFDLCVLSSTTALVAYVDSSNSNYPTVKPVALGAVV